MKENIDQKIKILKEEEKEIKKEMEYEKLELDMKDKRFKLKEIKDKNRKYRLNRIISNFKKMLRKRK